MYDYLEPRTPETFLYLRTTLAVDLATPELGALAEAYQPFALSPPHNDRAELLLPLEGATWENGLVLGLHSREHPQQLAKALAPALGRFDAWQIRNARGEWAEWIGEGPLSLYYGSRQRAIPTAQIFLGFEDAEDIDERAIDAVRAIYSPERCQPVLHLRDGRVLLLNTDEPARLIQNRMKKALDKIGHWCGCDHYGAPFARDDAIMWETVWLETLCFGNDDSE